MFFDLSNDLKMALRSFARAPGTSALIVATLAIAIGAATVGFTFADLAIFRGLPVDDNAKVVSFLAIDKRGATIRGRISEPDLLDYRARITTLEHLAGMRDGRAPLIRNGQSQTLTVIYATANLFAAMGQAPLQGRVFLPGEDDAGAPPVAVLSHHYWRDVMGSRPDAIGQTLQIGRDLVTIVGVLAPEMEFGNLAEADLWLPLRLSADRPRDARAMRFIGRLREGVTFEQAAAEMSAAGDALANEYPATNGGWKIQLVSIRVLTGGQGFWVVIALFMLSVALLLAIATANVSNLILVRAAARARDLAVRTALGARSGRLLRQFLVEGLLLSILGAALAIPAAWAALRALTLFSGEATFEQLRIDAHEISFVATLALICPAIFSLASTRMITRPDLRQVLASQGGRGATAMSRGRSALVIAQVALAVILLTTSTLAFKSLRAAFSQPLGMNISTLLTFGMDFNDIMYPDASAANAAANATRDALASVAGVTRVSMISALPVLGDAGPTAFAVDDRPVLRGVATPMAVMTGARADGIDILGVPLRAGSWWSEGDMNVAVIGHTTASRYFDGVDRAVGRHLSIQSGDKRITYRVVGVCGDIANTDRTEAAPARIWIPMPPSTRRITFIVDSPEPSTLLAAIRMAAASTVPSVPIENLQTLPEAMRLAEASDYVIIGVLAAFAGVAMLLATSGLFGVISFTVAQRTSEFGTRMALGAGVGDVMRLVARQSLRMVATGLVVGLAGGIGIGFLMGSLLFGLSPADLQTLMAVASLQLIVAAIATAIPALRASRIDPVIALRGD
jgi:putative ABC transport system permease protein